MIFIATDLDGTLFPNSGHSYNRDNYAKFREWAKKHRAHIHLAYITGRHLELTLNGIDEFKVPIPDYIVSDVGSAIYTKGGNSWEPLIKWRNQIKKDLYGISNAEISSWFSKYKKIYPQEEEKQSPYKISFYHNLKYDPKVIENEMKKILYNKIISTSLIMSIDYINKIGLIDIVPSSATKENALRFLTSEIGIPKEQVLYCGDSGNDILPITSEFPAILVGNAPENLRNEIKRIARGKGIENSIFYATLNYVEGIFQGIEHFQLDKFL